MARRLLLTYLTITAFTLAIVIIPLGRVFADREQSRLTADIEHDAQALASLVEDDLEAGTKPSIEDALTSYRTSKGRVVIVDARGVSVIDSDDPAAPQRDFSTRPEFVAALDGRRISGTRASDTLGTDLLYLAVPVASGGVVHGAVRITYPTTAVDARIRSTWLRLGALSAVVLALVAVVGVVFARQVSRPVRRLQVASGRLAAGELARVDEDDGPPELQALARTFNATATRLNQLIEAQRRFVADASHQLRTPLTALRLRLETLEPQIDDEARPKLDAAIHETERLAQLVQSLLVLARSDAAQLPPVPVELGPVIAARVDAWGPVATESSVTLRWSCADSVQVLAVPGAVEQILDNLLANAIEVAPAGTAIEVHVDLRGPELDLHVLDRGPGMDDAARAHAFERFWRRHADHTGAPRGFGLGLAIVSQLATASGGRARLDPGPGGHGLDAVVTLPRP